MLEKAPQGTRKDSMKTEFVDVSDTRKSLTIEIPTEEVDAEINRIARGFSKDARIPGFRPGKVPTSVIKQRFRDQILHEVTHTLIPSAVQQALEERGVEAVDSPNIEKIDLREGHPLTFTAAVDTLPPIEPDDVSTITLRRQSTALDADAVDTAIEQLRQRAATFSTVDDRAATEGDTVAMDLERTDAAGEKERHEDVSIVLGASGNPPGFDAEIIGMRPGDTRTFSLRFPDDYAAKELAGTEVSYEAALKTVRQRVLPEVNDEFAKDLGDFDSLGALRERVKTDLEHEAATESRRVLRDDLMKALSERLTVTLPASMIEREIERRLQQFVQQLTEQGIDPNDTGADWSKLRDAQRDPARHTVASALMLDALADRENLHVEDQEVDKGVERFAEQSGRTVDAVRAQLEKDGQILSLYNGLRREKAIDWVLERATIVDA